MSEVFESKEIKALIDCLDLPIGVFTPSGDFVFGNLHFQKFLHKRGAIQSPQFHAEELEWVAFAKKRRIFWHDLIDSMESENSELLVTFTDSNDLFACKISEIDLSGASCYLLQMKEKESPSFQEERVLARGDVFMRMLDELPAMICAADDHGVLKYWNKLCAEVTGYTKDEILGDPSVVDKIYPNPHYRRIIEEKIYRKENGSFRHINVDVVTKSGLSKTISWNLVYTHHPVVEGAHYWFIGTDATALFKAMNSLIESEERYAQISKASNDAVWDWNLKSNELWWNEGMSSLFGYDSSEIVNTYDWWFERLHPNYADSVNEKLMDAVRNRQEFWSDEYLFKRKDGSYAFIFDKGYIIKDEQGVPIRFVGGMVDITSIKEA